VTENCQYISLDGLLDGYLAQTYSHISDQILRYSNIYLYM